MNKICTSIEQSKKLIELGIDVNTADMFWDMAEPNERRKPLVGPISDYCDMEDWAVPAWSLTALISLLPDEIKHDGIVNNLWVTSEDVSYYSKEYDSYLYYEEGCTVDACVEMIMKLKELKLL